MREREGKSSPEMLIFGLEVEPTFGRNFCSGKRTGGEKLPGKKKSYLFFVRGRAYLRGGKGLR